MIRLFNNDAFKLTCFAFAAFLLAAILAPVVYNVGQFLAEITLNKSINPLVDYLGEHARRADFARFFNRSLYLSVLLLLPILFLSLRAKRDVSPRRGPWSFALPGRCVADTRGQALTKGSHPALQFLGGFILAAGLLSLVAFLLLKLELFESVPPESTPKLLRKSLVTGILVAIIEEILFRGVFLGIFLRSMRPLFAIVLLSALFAILHFLKPPKGLAVSDPESALAGFEFLSHIASRLLDPTSFLNEFCTLFVVGLILAATRYATSALWLPIGLHAGWVFALQSFEGMTQRKALESQSLWQTLIIGENLTQGLLPLAALGFTSVLLWVALRQSDAPALLAHDKPPNETEPPAA